MGGPGPLLAIATGCWVLALCGAPSSPQRPVLRALGDVWVPAGSELQLSCLRPGCCFFELLRADSAAPLANVTANGLAVDSVPAGATSGLANFTCRCYESGAGCTGGTGSAGSTGGTGSAGSNGTTSDVLTVVVFDRNLEPPTLSLPPPQPVPVPVPRGGHVRVLCEGAPPNATRLWLYRGGPGGVVVEQAAAAGGGSANFTLAPPEERAYVCSYEVGGGGGLSQPSPPLLVLVEAPQRPVLRALGDVWVPVDSKLRLSCLRPGCCFFELLRAGSAAPLANVTAKKGEAVYSVPAGATSGLANFTCRCYESGAGCTGSAGSTGGTGSNGTTSDVLTVVVFDRNLEPPTLSLPQPVPVPVPRGGHVRVLCEGAPPNATRLWLYRGGPGGVVVEQAAAAGGGSANFTLAPPEERAYVCSYEVGGGGGLSQPSPPLLVLVEEDHQIHPNFTSWPGCERWRATPPLPKN